MFLQTTPFVTAANRYVIVGVACLEQRTPGESDFGFGLLVSLPDCLARAVWI
jgi:hypothetical protein